MRTALAAALAAFVVFAAAASAGADQVYSYAVIPGVALGPLQLGHPFARARTLMPEPPGAIEQSEIRREDGTVETTAEVRWVRVATGEGDLTRIIVARYRDGKAVLLVGDDDLLNYRGVPLRSLTLEQVIAFLGAPERMEPRSPFSVTLVWNSAGVAFGMSAYNEDRRWTADVVLIFPRGGWDDI